MHACMYVLFAAKGPIGLVGGERRLALAETVANLLIFRHVHLQDQQ